MITTSFAPPSHVHCWHSVKAGHLTIQQCCRCKGERRHLWATAVRHAAALWRPHVKEVPA